MTPAALRGSSRRIVLELVVAGVVLGLAPSMPRDTAAAASWRFVLQHAGLAAHAVIATVVLAEGLAFGWRAVRAGRPAARAVSLTGAAFVVAAWISGLVYASTPQHGPALAVMSLGWVGAVVTYSTGWALGHRRAIPPRSPVGGRLG